MKVFMISPDRPLLETSADFFQALEQLRRSALAVGLQRNSVAFRRHAVDLLIVLLR